ncbi:hypothetical protein VOLCADRAFT_89886 [Volvox carteri f. nagariensis]|uniref:Uncharacterized protein n=1 Tax=Volvox carteri f. nagariensis TaxID=3068 RepID=D8TSX3_VOLCA|nr:uncharacterized protein VOLCADRAFT_89886 [Volvox carteri f. nagariensis]EFJ49557.1 hypothetical protein VOLCADRAFT_89886 [Volvox carteri f. nagariensis]|eukprot:XP_002949538.1 hypothetical protein VOLCADRAFT_89886 [Volvox carteri f. nagariensis]
MRHGTSLLTEKDLKFLRDRDADNQQVFDVWSQRKHLELQLEREEQERMKADSQARFEARENQIQEQNQTAVKQWTQRKVKQQKAEAEDSYLKQIKLRALEAYHQRLNGAYEAKCKKREEAFAVRSGVAHIPHTFDAFRAERATKAAHPRLSKEKSAASYRSLLEEADREGDEEAALIAMMGGTHPLVAVARQKSGDMPSADGGGYATNSNLSLEPSFASAAARQGNNASGTLPPLGRHLVSPAVLAQYLPPPSHRSKASESGGLGAERSGIGLRRSSDVAGDDDGFGDEGSSIDTDAPQAVLPPNITSIYAPREVIGAIVQEERDAAQDEFQQRLKAAAEDSLRKVEAAYMPIPPSSAMTEEGASGQKTADSDDTAAMLHVSPAFFAAYCTSSGDGSAPPPPPLVPVVIVRGSGGAGSSSRRSSSPAESTAGGDLPDSARPEHVQQQPEDVEPPYSEDFGGGSGDEFPQGSAAYSRSASGGSLGPLPVTAQAPSAASLGRHESRSSSRASSSSRQAPASAAGQKRRSSSKASRATQDSVVTGAVATDNGPSGQIASLRGSSPPASGVAADAGPSRPESGASHGAASRRGPVASSLSGGGRSASLRESEVDRRTASRTSTPAAVADAPSASTSRRASELSDAAAAVTTPRLGSGISAASMPGSNSAGGNASATATTSGAVADRTGRKSDSMVGVEPSLGLLPVAPVGAARVEPQAAARAKEEEESGDEESSEEEESEMEEESEVEEEEESAEEDDEEQGSGKVEPREQSEEEEEEEDSVGVRNTGDGSLVEGQTEEEEEEEEEDEEEEEEDEEEEEEEEEEDDDAAAAAAQGALKGRHS